MRQHKYLFIGVVLVVLSAIVTGGVWFLGHKAGAQTSPTPTVSSISLSNQSHQTEIDAIADQVLLNMHLHAWNPIAMTKGQVTGGLFINWEMSDPSITNDTRPGPDGNAQHDHDPQVDLLYLTSLAEYQQLHPGDHRYNADLSRAISMVHTDFQRYSLPKGWIYFYLLDDGLLLHRLDIVNEAYNVAANLYTTWYDPALRTVYDRLHNPGDYSTNDTLESGVALIKAGMLWNQPEWVSAGENTVDHTVSVAFNQKFDLFYDSMLIRNGQDQVKSYEARPSTDGEAIEALVTAFTLTHRQHYLDIATSVLKSLFTTSGLWDNSHGGFFFTLKLDSGTLVTNYKETRSQTLVLVGLHDYNLVSRQPFTNQEQQLISVITDHFYQPTYHGFVYRLTPDFQIYVSKPGAGIGVEDYFTTEAMGAALDALQRTEFVKPL